MRSSTSTTRVRIDREALIERLARAKALLIDKHGKAQATYEADLMYFNRRLFMALTELADRVNEQSPEKAIARLGTRYHGKNKHTIEVTIKVPTKPQPIAHEVKTIEKMIRALEVANDDEIVVKADGEFAAYL